MADEQIIIDTALVQSIIRERGRRWFALGATAAALMTAAGLLLMPQNFTARTSVATQQQAGSGGGALSILAGASGQNKRYLGVLKSRHAAEEVEQQVHLKTLYNLRTEDDALDMLQKAIKPDDNAADGLLYISVSLPGPAKFAPQNARRQQVKLAAAAAANAYVESLRKYYLINDTDRETVLVRSADEELAHARAAYNKASNKLHRFITGLRNVDPRATPTDDSGNPDGKSELSQFYTQLGQVEAQISAAEASYGTQKRLMTGLLDDVNAIPAEDPLLTAARDAVNQDRDQLRLLEVQFGPKHPSVVRTHERLKIDEQRLQTQMAGVRTNRTSQQIGTQAQIESLRARQATLQRLILEAESHLNTGRQLSGDLLAVKTEWQLSLGALKVTIEESAKIRMQNVGAKSRMSVIDPADPPKTGSPGTLVFILSSMFLAGTAIFMALIRAYITELRRQVTPAYDSISGHKQPAESLKNTADDIVERTGSSRS